jgi:hypothetical protein
MEEVHTMKRAVIVVGSHHAGKSKTIKKFFKPLVGISGNRRLFQIGQHKAAVLSQSLEERFGNGHVLSQSLEEKGLVDVRGVVANYQHYERLVFAARPSSEARSLYGTLKSELESRGFSVATVSVVRNQPDSFYAERAQEILRHLQ